MEFEEAVVAQVCEVLTNLKSPDPRTQAQIFERFRRLQLEQPMLCFLLVHVLVGERFATDLRYAAILVLYRNLDHIGPDVVQRFIEYAVPIMKKLIQEGDSFLGKYAVAILTALLAKYGIEACPFFFELVTFLFQKEETMPDAVNCLSELALVKKDVPEELLSLAVPMIGGPSTYQILTVFRKVVHHHVDFVCERVLPLILSNCASMTPACVGESGAIAVVCYGRYPEPVIGAFIAQCIMNDSCPIHSCTIAEMLDSPLTEIFEPIILALMHRIAFQDEEFMSDGTCVMCQTILEEMAKWSSEVPPIVLANLEKCANPGHFCRCLYPVIQVLPNASDFIGVLESQTQGPFKGDAATCLMSACFSVPDYAGRAIDVIIPMLGDEREYVRQQCLFSLTELFEFEFEPRVAILEFLIQNFRVQPSANMVACAQLINRYVVHFHALEFTPLIQEFFQYICHSFMESSAEHQLLPSAAETLASLVQLAPGSQDLIPPILMRVQYLLSVDDPDLISSLCFLLGCLVRGFSDVVDGSDVALSICQRISLLLIVDDNPQMVISVLDPVGQILEKTPHLAASFAEAWVLTMTSIFTVSNMELSGTVAQILINLVAQMPPGVCQELLHKCGLVMMMSSDLTESQMKIFDLGDRIIHHIEANGGSIDESIRASFASKKKPSE